MHIVHTRGKADHLAFFDRDGDVMAAIAEELGHEVRLEGVVEHVGRDSAQNGLVT